MTLDHIINTPLLSTDISKESNSIPSMLNDEKRKEDDLMIEEQPNRLTNTIEIYNGDCYTELPKINVNIPINLAYIDIPFNSQKKYNIHDENNVEIQQFNDIWESIDTFITWFKPRLQLLYTHLDIHGSLYLHCDNYAVHYLKLLCDKIFGKDHFQSMIIWQTTSKNFHGMTKFGRNYDTILFYTKSNEYTFNSQYATLDSSYVKKSYNKRDERGYFKCSDLTSGIISETQLYEWKGIKPRLNRCWMFSIEKMQELDADHRIYYSTNKIPYLKTYLTENEGIPIQDLWLDIQPITKSPIYPTQKPEELLERIIKTSSNQGDTILDCFCGSGTTLVVGHRLKRNVIGIDSNTNACTLTAERLKFDTRKIVDYDITLETIFEWNMDKTKLYYLHDFVCATLNLPNTRGHDKGFDGKFIDNNGFLNVLQTKGSKTPASIGELNSFFGAIAGLTPKESKILRKAHFIASSFSAEFTKQANICIQKYPNLEFCTYTLDTIIQLYNDNKKYYIQSIKNSVAHNQQSQLKNVQKSNKKEKKIFELIGLVSKSKTKF